jgi:death-on-curing protein
MRYIYPNQVIFLHKQIISSTGGSHGVREKGLLESAVYRPQASFGGTGVLP